MVFFSHLRIALAQSGVERFFSGAGFMQSDQRKNLKETSFKHALKVKSVGKA